ncbi:MAG: hypothetical protein U5K54_01610 [Cytophagales bacterium]|nr:hypothetical protein [Cytophagales bacterium]
MDISRKQEPDEQEALAIENAKIAREAEIRAAQSQKEAEMQRAHSEVALRALGEAISKK